MSKFPLRSLANAIHLPSGDQAGFSSQAAPLVIPCGPLPFGATVAMSKSWPVASEVAIASRLPFGDQLGWTSMPALLDWRIRWARPEADNVDPDGAAALAAERDHGPRRGGARDATGQREKRRSSGHDGKGHHRSARSRIPNPPSESALTAVAW